MITIIFGESGSGKSALGTYFLNQLYLSEGKEIFERSCNEIECINAFEGRDYACPDRTPFYTNYDVRLHLGYKWYYEPYFLNGYYFGLRNNNMDTQFVPPYAKIWFDEAHRYFFSRKASSFPSWAAQAFSEHRHFGLEMFLMTPRLMEVDPCIRQNTNRFIEVCELKNSVNFAGIVERSVWRCREWQDFSSVERYLGGNVENYAETVYRYEGNIFDNFDSYSHKTDFLPKRGCDFSYLSQRRDGSEQTAKFYNTIEPKEFRRGGKAS